MDPITLILILAGALATIGGTVASAATNRQNQVDTNNMNRDLSRETNAQNMELAQQQHQWDLDMWNMQNAYNAPSAQMQRFRAAGLNPSLMYGSGTGIMNEAAPAQAAPNMAGMLKTPYMQSLMQNLDFGGSSLIQTAAQNALTRSEARLNNANAAVIEQTTPGKVENLTRQNELLNTRVDQVNTEIAVLNKRIDLMDSEQKLNLEKTVTEQFNRGLADKDYQLRYDEFQETLRMNKVLEHKIKAEIGEIGTRIMRNKQDYLYYQEANAKLLLGLDYKNALIDSEIKLNKINAALGGFEVASGLIDFKQDMANYHDFMGHNGDINRIGSSILNGLTWGLKRVSNSINIFKLSK